MPNPQIVASVQAEHQQISAQFDQFEKAFKALDATRTAMDELMKKGNGVTVDDVIEAAGKHVAAGHNTPQGMASLLSEMPTTDGPLLAAWVQQKDQALRAMEQQFAPKLEMARQALTTSALRTLQARHLAGPPQMPQLAQGQMQEPGSESEPPTGNALSPGA